MPRHDNRLSTGLALLIASALLVGACGGSSGKFTNLTADDPVAQIAEGLTLSVRPAALTQDVGVQLNAIAAETFTSGQAGSEWGQALQALPMNLRLQGPLFEIRTNGKMPQQIFLAVTLPGGSDPARHDLYAWDGKAWTFLPSHALGGQLVASVSQVPAALGLFEAVPLPPLAFTTLEPGQALTAAAASAVNGVLLGGVTVQANGSLGGQLPGVALDPAFARYPVIRNFDASGLNADALTGLLTDPAVRANHLQQIVSFVASGGYDGLVLDYRGVNETLRPAYTRLVVDLGAQLHAQRKALFVQVEPPSPASQAGGSFTTGGYDWRALDAAADALLLPAPEDPTAISNGSAEALLAWAVGEVSRSHLWLITSALSVESAGSHFTLLDQNAALAPLGSATLAPDVQGTPYPGQPITVTLSGQAQTLDYDARAFAARYTYADESGTPHTVWLTSVGALRQRLALPEKYHLGGVVVSDLLAPGVPANLAMAIMQYRVNLMAEVQAQAGLVWTVSGASGVMAQTIAQPGQPYVYVAQTPGDYQISAELRNDGTLPLGAVSVSVAEVTPTPSVATGTSGDLSSATTGSSTGTSGGGSSTGFVPPPPMAGGPFELGGQVPGFIGHLAQMKQAGMTWVKFQATGDTASFISAGHASGLKVLLSAVGDKAQAANPTYWSQYAAWVAGMAAQGADAIEVWNEANLDREWPNGQISGATYTELLKQAYAAIKAANPNTLVIGGAPAPTGAAGGAGCIPALCNDDVFLEQMANAGAASYMDCVGVHFNSGTTSPNDTNGSALSGYHYSYYFWPMLDLYYNAFGGSRPLCFTELGYVSPQGYEAVPLPAYFQWAANTTVAQQAQWLAESASLAASSGKVRLMIIFNVDFTVYLSNDPQAGYAIIRPDGTCPACAALDAVMP